MAAHARLPALLRAATRALPLLRPDRTLRFIELPPGQDPDDVIRSGRREAFEQLLASTEPLDARLWRHELEAEPLTTPEAWAGLKARLVAHASTIGHSDLSRIYREDWLDRFFRQRRPSWRVGCGGYSVHHSSSLDLADALADTGCFGTWAWAGCA